MKSVNIQMIGRFQSTIEVSKYTVKSLQEAVTEKYGIPGENLKFKFEDGSGFLSPTDNYNSSKQIQVLVDTGFVMKGTKVFIEDMTKLMSDPETADFTLKVGNKSFKVHKAVLGARSEVFRTMFLSNMKEGVKGEGDITDLNEETIQEVLHYLYTGILSGKDYGIYSLC